MTNALLLGGLGVGVLGALDPALAPLAPLGALAVGLRVWLSRREARSRHWAALSVACGLALAAYAQPDLRRADTVFYYSYLRSAAFDRDLHFANERRHFAVKDAFPDTPTGHRPNPLGPGAALLWSPFFVVAHVWVLLGRAVGWSEAAADGYSLPYLRSMLVGTTVAVSLGAFLLWRLLAGRVGSAVAGLAVLATVAATPVLYYTLVVPGMAHGPAFAAAAAFAWAWGCARESGERSSWIALGGLLGLLVITRYQAAAVGLLAAPLALRALADQASRRNVALAAAAAAAAFLPQMVCWRLIDGSWLRLPGGAGMRYRPGAEGIAYLDVSAPRLLDVLLSADHGLLTWTPLAVPALLGLAFAPRAWGWLARGGLLVVLATWWLNSIRPMSWTGEDAFGARRFDVAWPFLAAGLAVVVEACRRRPLMLPALALSCAAAWNVGLMALYQRRVTPNAAPLERAAEAQAHQLRRVLENLAGGVAGPRGRALVYKVLVGEYLYSNINPSGTIALGSPETRYLAGGWSAPMNRSGPATFRWARFPQACVQFPLEGQPQSGFRTSISVRAPEELDDQTMTVVANAAAVGEFPVGAEWSQVEVVLPWNRLVPGENTLCLRFSKGVAERARRAAAVSVIQLP